MMSSKLYDELQKGNISEIITKRITDALISGELKPGDKIPTEMEFSKSLGISRNAYREAIKVLVAFGVLEIRRAEGTFVVKEYNNKLMDPLIYGLILADHTMEELLETKIAVSSAMLYIAMKNATDEDAKRLIDYAKKFKKAMHEIPYDINKIYEAGDAYHQCKSKIVKNRMLLTLNDFVRQVATFTRYRAIEVSLERGCLDTLPDNYIKEAELLERRDQSEIPNFMDERLRMWKELLC